MAKIKVPLFSRDMLWYLLIFGGMVLLGALCAAVFVMMKG